MNVKAKIANEIAATQMPTSHSSPIPGPIRPSSWRGNKHDRPDVHATNDIRMGHGGRRPWVCNPMLACASLLKPRILCESTQKERSIKPMEETLYTFSFASIDALENIAQNLKDAGAIADGGIF